MLTREVELAILYELSSISSDLNDVDEILNTGLDKVVRVLNSYLGIFYLWDPDQGQLVASAASGIHLKKVLPAFSLEHDGVRLDRSTISWVDPEPFPFPIDPLQGRYEALASLGVPVQSGSRLMAWLYAARLNAMPFTETEISLFNVLASKVGSALELVFARQRDAQRHEELRKAHEAAEAARRSAEEANQFKSRFIASMSHELRTPLNTIINFTDFMSDPDISGSLNEQQKMLQGRVISSAEHLLGLINDILDLAKIESGKMELFRETVDLGPLLEGVRATAIGLTKDKGLRVTLELPETPLPSLQIDKTRTRQVLLNLLSNAAKFTEQGGITLRAVELDTGVIQISVQDTGIGIPEDKQHVVFEEFRQVESESNRKYTGTGLGMPISKKLVEMHGGTMWFESTPGIGTTFYFTLPIATAPALAPPGDETLAAPGDEQAEDGRRPMILVVDDDPNAHKIIEAHLHGQRYRIAGITDTREALEAIRQQRPQLIILDVIMPHVDGWELLSKLRDDPLTQSIPVVMCSILDQQKLGFTLGAQAYLAKPTRAEDLLPIVQRLTTAAATVLVVDDSQQSREITRAHLAHAGYQVEEAASGEEGLSKAELLRPQLLILDLMMPGMDGFELLQQLRMHASLATIPVIIMTAKDLQEHERAWLQRQAEACVQKHTGSPGELIKLVEELISLER